MAALDGGWFDLLMIDELPIDRKRAIVRQVGWLFLRRGTRVGLERLSGSVFRRDGAIDRADRMSTVISSCVCR